MSVTLIISMSTTPPKYPAIKPKTTPITVETAAEMADANKIYVYVGNEPGYSYGYWYYYDPDTQLWTRGDIYGGYELDTALSSTSQNAVTNAAITAGLNTKQNTLTLPLPITQGGTGASTAANARSNLGITLPLPITQGGTGANSASSARTNLGITLPLPITDGGTGADNADDARANLGVKTKNYVFSSTARTFTVPANSRHILIMGGSNTTNNYGIWLMGATSNNAITIAEVAKGSNITLTVSGTTITILSQTYGATLLDWALTGNIIEPDE